MAVITGTGEVIQKERIWQVTWTSRDYGLGALTSVLKQ